MIGREPDVELYAIGDKLYPFCHACGWWYKLEEWQTALVRLATHRKWHWK